MARPARPAAEIAAVREAAAVVQGETGLVSPPAAAREVARRAVAALLAEIARDPEDPFLGALAAMAQRFAPSPFDTLAVCPEIDLATEFVEYRIERLRARSGRDQSKAQSQIEQNAIAKILEKKLTDRYLRHLRSINAGEKCRSRK